MTARLLPARALVTGTLLALVLALVLAVTLPGPPAQARDGEVWVDLPGSTTLAPDSGATWHDRGNRLCAVDTGQERTVARLTVLRSGTFRRIRSPAGVARRCTRPRVAEDARARLAVCARLPSGTVCHRVRVRT